MANIEGGSILPGVSTIVETLSRGASVPGGTRIAAFIGEGSRSETVVASALGGGQDGLDPTYTSTSGSDGRHFALTLAPIISNRTQLFRSGLPLVGLEQTITTSSTFSDAYDYRIDIETGHIELQTAHLVDQGGLFYVSGAANTGAGTIGNLQLLDVNAPSETWSIKCISVSRNGLNQPIAQTAKFIAVGTVSGNKLDANGNPIVWTSNGTVTSNSILSFKIIETTPFVEGDNFIVKVNSGVLNANDTLTASYIPVSNLNDPLFIANMDEITKKHGPTSLDNNLSLGCQLAFANQAPGIMCVQAAPPMPRRTSYQLTTNFLATSTNPDDFVFPLPPGVEPNINSNIHFFVKNNTTNVEKQVLPNKFPFFTLDTIGNPSTSTFVLDSTDPPGGNGFSYSVNSTAEALVSGFDGYITEDILAAHPGYRYGIFESSIVFDSSFKRPSNPFKLKIIDTLNVANQGSFDINDVVAGKLHVSTTGNGSTPFGDFINESPITFELLDPLTGLLLVGSNGTDGVLTTVGPGSEQATLTSGAVDFSAFQADALLKIAGSASNNGTYDLVSTGSFTCVIRKRIVSESSLRYEIVDTALGAVSNFVVVNKKVVPAGNTLRITIVDSRDATFFDAGWINALASLESQEIDVLVTLPKQTISVIFQNALAHCRVMSNTKNKKERVLFLGAINGLLPVNLTGAKPAAVEDIGVLEGIQGETIADVLAGNVEDLTNYSVADSFGNTFRAVYFYPDQIVAQVGTDNVLIDGFYIAAAAAGFISATNSVAMPLTNKVLTGFTILRNKQFSPLTLEQLALAGVTVLQPVQGGGNVIWGITTTQSGFPEEQEISIVFIRDRIAKNLRTGFKAFIGLPEDDALIAKLTARAVALLNSFISQGLISDYKDLLVVRDSVDPRQWNISVRVQPTYPVNFILIRVSVGLL